MAQLIVTQDELNDLKIAKAILMNINTSWLLARNKLYVIAEIIGYEDDQLCDDWVEVTCDMIMEGRYQQFKQHLLKELLYMEAYLEIEQLGLHKIKLPRHNSAIDAQSK